MRKTFRILVTIALACAGVALLSALVPAFFPSGSRYYYFLAPGSFVAGLADLVRTPAITFALASAVGAVFVRALTWQRKAPAPAGRRARP
ncbi:hypothetical protein [Leifsonia sp. NPDC058230]|uniref:hypothetical protein n=1 Tax=Leifsonia sp. NPDC058230 TaxID=3346391 RepID=UPI0036DA3E70